MNYCAAAILGIVEGITEFLPISSTGHMILASAAMRLQDTEFLKTFEIFIQLGAVCAIVVLYAWRLVGNYRLYQKLAAAFLPTAVLGFLFYKLIKAYLFNPIVVSVALIAGGIVLVLIDKRMRVAPEKPLEIEDMSFKHAFLIGLCQSVSMVPGVSRAAATIIGGMFNGLGKRQAIEFSFLLAVPTMFAAAGYDVYKMSAQLSGSDRQMLAFGWLISFLAAWMAVKLFLRFADKHVFAAFGYYRIVLGVVFLMLLS